MCPGAEKTAAFSIVAMTLLPSGKSAVRCGCISTIAISVLHGIRHRADRPAANPQPTPEPRTIPRLRQGLRSRWEGTIREISDRVVHLVRTTTHRLRSTLKRPQTWRRHDHLLRSVVRRVGDGVRACDG